jgi:hypothetical protein
LTTRFEEKVMVENSPFQGQTKERRRQGKSWGVEWSDEKSFNGLVGRRRGEEKVSDIYGEEG